MPKGQQNEHRRVQREKRQQRFRFLQFLDVLADPPDQFLHPDEAAAVLNISTRTITRLIQMGQIAVYRIGGQNRIAPRDLAEYVRTQRYPAHGGERGKLQEHCTPGAQEWARYEEPEV